MPPQSSVWLDQSQYVQKKGRGVSLQRTRAGGRRKEALPDQRPLSGRRSNGDLKLLQVPSINEKATHCAAKDPANTEASQKRG